MDGVGPTLVLPAARLELRLEVRWAEYPPPGVR
jgi:hypothetical protein